MEIVHVFSIFFGVFIIDENVSKNVSIKRELEEEVKEDDPSHLTKIEIVRKIRSGDFAIMKVLNSKIKKYSLVGNVVSVESSNLEKSVCCNLT